MNNLFLEISILVLFAIIISGILRYLKQPLIIGYIFTGILASPYFFDLVSSREAIEAFSEIGVAILLFLVGIHLNPNIIKDVGKVSLITGLGQIIFTSLIGFILIFLIGFSFIESVYIAIALTFSSTIIIMKLLSDKGHLDSLYGRISLGFLIVQDLVAMFILMFLSVRGQGGNLASILVETILIGGSIIILFLLFGYYILPSIMNQIAKSQEFLLLFTIGWCLGAASLFYYLNFSIEVGALLAGITLSISPYRHHMSSLLKPLRDFFILMFFLFLGSQMVFEGISNYILEIIGLSIFILIGNTLIVLILLTKLGYSSRTGFFSGLTVAQISEFSLILIALGVSIGDISPEILSFVTIIGIITISGSTYMILYNNTIYDWIKPVIKLFEKRTDKENNHEVKKDKQIILLGCHRIGTHLLENFKDEKTKLLVVDHNPQVIKLLKKEGFNALYGDVTDDEFINSLNLKKAKLVISTIPDKDINEFLLKKIKTINENIILIMSARHSNEAKKLYDEKADYVIMPYYLGGEHIAQITRKHAYNKEKYEKEKENHLNSIKKFIHKELEELR